MAKVDSARRVTLFLENNTPYESGPSLRFNTVLQPYILNYEKSQLRFSWFRNTWIVELLSKLL